jgi:1-deoxy-D-xylulose-5-phosphate synthase
VLADAGLTEQDIARRIAEWTAGLTERAETHETAPAERP